MSQLIIAILVIVLMAIVVAGGINYVSTDIGTRRQAESLASTGFRAWNAAFSSYRLANGGVYPDEAEEKWRADLAPYLPLGEPTTPYGMTWSYGESGNGRYFCLSGSVSESAYEGLLEVPSKHASGAVELTDACNGVSESSPDAVALTFWSLPK